MSRRSSGRSLWSRSTPISSPAERERREAQQRHNEARKQRDLLLAGDSAFNSDFYTYRYLASQGFLPGYNFPRLPLMAYIPARRGNVGRESFLSRPRFLALGEFGPYSLIYHEGSQYRVTKALLTVTGQDQVSEGATLATEVARLCPMCGYGHFRTQRDADRCVSCDASLDGAEEVKNLLLRLRHQLSVTKGAHTRLLLCEETVAVAATGSDPFTELPPQEARALLGAEATRNMPSPTRDHHVQQALNQLPGAKDTLEAIAKSRADTLLADHRRVREAAEARGSYQVTASLPVDVMGVYVLVPGTVGA